MINEYIMSMLSCNKYSIGLVIVINEYIMSMLSCNNYSIDLVIVINELCYYVTCLLYKPCNDHYHCLVNCGN